VVISMNHLKDYVLDRYEGAYAVLEDSSGRTYDVLCEELPANLREGDILHENDGTYVVDEKATEEKRKKLKQISDALTKNN
jgi:hypothetical protein